MNTESKMPRILREILLEQDRQWRTSTGMQIPNTLVMHPEAYEAFLRALRSYDPFWFQPLNESGDCTLRNFRGLSVVISDRLPAASFMIGRVHVS
jgi:hypothetical protein